MTTTKVIIGGVIASLLLIFLCLFFNAERYYKVLDAEIHKIPLTPNIEEPVEETLDVNLSKEIITDNDVNESAKVKAEQRIQIVNSYFPPTTAPSNQKILLVEEARVEKHPEENGSLLIDKKILPVGIQKDSQEIEVLQKKILRLLEKNQITFKKNSGNIDKEGKAVLDKIIALLSDADEIFLEIQGHTDAGGQREINRQISQMRANRVKKYLIKRGFVSKYIDALGFGESTLLLPNDKFNSRNRRVEIYIKRR